MLVLVDGHSIKKEVGGKGRLSDAAGKVQEEPGHLVLTDMRKCSMSNVKGHVNAKGLPLARFRTTGATEWMLVITSLFNPGNKVKIHESIQME